MQPPVVQLPEFPCCRHEKTGQGPEYQKGPQDSQDHLGENVHFCSHSLLVNSHIVIGNSQKHRRHKKAQTAEYRILQEIFLLFSPCSDKLHQSGPAYGKGIKDHDHQVDQEKIQDAFPHCLAGDHKFISGYIRLKQVGDHQRHKLGKAHPGQQSYSQGDQAHPDGLQPQHSRQFDPPHTQGKIDPKFLFPLFQHKPAGIDDQISQDQRYENAHPRQNPVHRTDNGGFRLGYLHHGCLGLDGIKDIENCHPQDHSKKVNRIIPDTFSEIFQRQTKQHGSDHLPAVQ